MLLARLYKYLLYKLGDNNNNVGDRWSRAFTTSLQAPTQCGGDGQG